MDYTIKRYVCPHFPLDQNKERCKLWLSTLLKYVKTYLKPARIIILYARYENGRRLEKDLAEIYVYDDKGRLIEKHEELW